ncbi:MAG: YeeE/YedE thiosulfate transporter family protein [Betaproteobacteria bacterium]
MLDTLFPNGIASYATGGLLMGAGVALLYVTTGLVGGMSTLFSAVWSFVSRAPHFSQARYAGSRAWRLALAAGLVLGAALWTVASGQAIEPTTIPAPQLVVAGLIAGFGARMANGCTSGHGICGLASLQASSLAAVAVFMATAIATANLVQALR